MIPYSSVIMNLAVCCYLCVLAISRVLDKYKICCVLEFSVFLKMANADKKKWCKVTISDSL